MAQKNETRSSDSNTVSRQKVEAENDASVEAVLALMESQGWAQVTSKPSVTVFKKFLQPRSPRVPSAAPNQAHGEPVLQATDGDEGSSSSSCGGHGVRDEEAGAKFACVKVVGTIDAIAEDVYKLFRDIERVHEYNENVVEVRDLEWFSPDTKISWSATRRIGPILPRDFVTLVHYRDLPDGRTIVVNRPAEHPDARRGKKYVRAQVLRAGNVIRPNPQDPTKTDFTTVMHINPGGWADSWLGAKVVNVLCGLAAGSARRLEAAANRPAPAKTTDRRA